MWYLHLANHCKSGSANLFNVQLKYICCIFLMDYFVWVKCCKAELAKSLDSNYRYMYRLRWLIANTHTGARACMHAHRHARACTHTHTHTHTHRGWADNSSVLAAGMRKRDAGAEGKRGKREVEEGWMLEGGIPPCSKVKLVMSAMTHSSQHALLTSRIWYTPLFCCSPLMVQTQTSCSLNQSGCATL